MSSRRIGQRTGPWRSKVQSPSFAMLRRCHPAVGGYPLSEVRHRHHSLILIDAQFSPWLPLSNLSATACFRSSRECAIALPRNCT
jgi:hypothetical protein